MNRGTMRNIVVSSMVILLLVADASAQEEISVGRIRQIAETRGEDLEETRYAQVRRGTISGWDQARRDAPLYDQNLVRLLRNRIFVDLDLTDLRAVLGSTSLSVVGTYLIRADAEAPVDTLSRLEVVVVQGTMIVEDVKKTLRVFAADTRVFIFGTTVLFHVEESETEGTLFLSEGSIGFPDFNIPASGTNRAWHLQSGQPPVELTLTGAELKQWQHEVQYNTSSIWQSRPVWQRLSFKNPLIYPGAVVLGGGIYLLVKAVIGNGDDGIAIPPPRPSGN